MDRENGWSTHQKLGFLDSCFLGLCGSRSDISAGCDMLELQADAGCDARVPPRLLQCQLGVRVATGDSEEGTERVLSRPLHLDNKLVNGSQKRFGVVCVCW